MKLLTDIQICELMGWQKVSRIIDKSYVGAPDECVLVWILPNNTQIDTPNFDTMNPWFEFVIPWLHKNKIHYLISSCRGQLATHVILQDKNYSLLGSDQDKDPAMALRKALTEYANRSK